MDPLKKLIKPNKVKLFLKTFSILINFSGLKEIEVQLIKSP